MRCDQEVALGAYLLDVLEPDERARVRAHLERCPVCAEIARELAGVHRVLAGADLTADDVAGAEAALPQPSEFAYQRFRAAASPSAPAAAGGAGRRWRSWRALAVAAAALVVIGGGIVAGVVVTSSRPAAEPATVTAAASGVSARAEIASAGSGSRITLTLDGVPLGERCRLEVVSRTGARAGTHWWTIGRTGPLSWTDSVPVAAGDIDRLDVVTADGRTLLTLRA